MQRPIVDCETVNHCVPRIETPVSVSRGTSSPIDWVKVVALVVGSMMMIRGNVRVPEVFAKAKGLTKTVIAQIERHKSLPQFASSLIVKPSPSRAPAHELQRVLHPPYTFADRQPVLQTPVRMFEPNFIEYHMPAPMCHFDLPSVIVCETVDGVCVDSGY